LVAAAGVEDHPELVPLAVPWDHIGRDRPVGLNPFGVRLADPDIEDVIGQWNQ